MTIYCRKCKGILNKHQTTRCPECGTPTAEPDPVAEIKPYETIQPSAEANEASPEVLAVMDAKVAEFRPARAAEHFTPSQMVAAIDQWLEFGERMLAVNQQAGYFSGCGWAARALAAARDFIQKAGAE
jgi:hypothetical protein